MADPIAVVKSIETFEADPDNPATKTLIGLKVGILNVGPSGEIDLFVSIDNGLTKNQIKTAINSAIIADFAARGASLTAQRIFTVADIAG